MRATDELWLSTSEGEMIVHGPGGILRQRGEIRSFECTADREALFPGARDLLASDFVPMSACPGSPALWRRTGASWTFVQDLPAHEILAADWTRKRTLLLSVPWRPGPPWGYALEVVGNGTAPRPASAPSDSSDGDPRPCYTRLQDPLRLWSFASGDVFVVGGAECPEPIERSLVVEHWEPGATRGRFDRLPLEALTATAAPAPDNLWLAGTLRGAEGGWLVHFDGKGWSLLRPPVIDTIAALAWQPAGVDRPEALWLLSDSAIRRWSEPRHSGGDAPETFVPPAECPTPGALAVQDGHPWISCGNAVRTTDPSAKTLDWPFTSGAPCPRRWIRHGASIRSECEDHGHEIDRPRLGPGNPRVPLP